MTDQHRKPYFLLWRCACLTHNQPRSHTPDSLFQYHSLLLPLLLHRNSRYSGVSSLFPFSPRLKHQSPPRTLLLSPSSSISSSDAITTRSFPCPLGPCPRCWLPPPWRWTGPPPPPLPPHQVPFPRERSGWTLGATPAHCIYVHVCACVCVCMVCVRMCDVCVRVWCACVWCVCACVVCVCVSTV